MNIIFENGSSKFVITPNTPIAHAFTLPQTGEDLKTLTQRLLRERLNDPTITLS
jgi:CyaY protein